MTPHGKLVGFKLLLTQFREFIKGYVKLVSPSLSGLWYVVTKSQTKRLLCLC